MEGVILPPMPNKKTVPTKTSKTAKTNGGETHQQATTDVLLTTNQGLPISDNQNSLKGGGRGPTLLEDFILREKITHFDHERIPERIVHARGSGAHGYFQPYKSMKHVTSANFLSDPKIKTPVFVRFSTVAGGAGSVDLPRDVRGFAVKFYTQEGNFDLVGNNIPVFFIQDAIKFPDLIHSVKMEADRHLKAITIAGIPNLAKKTHVEGVAGVTDLRANGDVSKFIDFARNGKVWERDTA
jgi:catalase